MAAPASTITFAITGPITRDDLPGLCDRVCALLEEGSASVAYCDVTGVGVDAVTVDALARLQLGARRRDCTVRLLNASPELLALVRFLGLDNVIAVSDTFSVRHRQRADRTAAAARRGVRHLCRCGSELRSRAVGVRHW